MKIRIIRNQKVVTDSDLAQALNIPTKQLLNMFRRNKIAFKEGTFFTLSDDEQQDLIANYCTTHAERLRYAKRLPSVFTLPSIIMLLCMQSKVNAEAKQYRDKLWSALGALPAEVFDAEKIINN